MCEERKRREIFREKYAPQLRALAREIGGEAQAFLADKMPRRRASQQTEPQPSQAPEPVPEREPAMV